VAHQSFSNRRKARPSRSGWWVQGAEVAAVSNFPRISPAARPRSARQPAPTGDLRDLRPLGPLWALFCRPTAPRSPRLAASDGVSFASASARVASPQKRCSCNLSGVGVVLDPLRRLCRVALSRIGCRNQPIVALRTRPTVPVVRAARRIATNDALLVPAHLIQRVGKVVVRVG